MPKHVLFAVLVATLAVSLAEGQHLEATIRLPESLAWVDYPTAMAYDSAGNTLYVGERYHIAAIECSTNRLTASLFCGGTRLGFNPLRRKLYALGYDLRIIDAATRRELASFPLRMGHGEEEPVFAYNSANDKMFLAAYDSNGVYVFDGATDSLVAFVDSIRKPFGLVYSPSQNKVYVLTIEGRLAVIDGSGDSLLKIIRLGSSIPYRSICYDPDDDKIYAASDELSVIDCVTDSVINTIRGFFWDLHYSSRRRCVYALDDNDDLLEVDCQADSLVRWLVMPTEVYGLELVPSADRAYCVLKDFRLVAVDCSTLTEVSTSYVVSSSFHESRFCTAAGESLVYYSDAESGTIGAIDAATSRIVANIIAGWRYEPRNLVYLTGRNRLYCYDEAVGGLSVIDGVSNNYLGTKVVGTHEMSHWVYCEYGDKVYSEEYLMDSLAVLGGSTDTIIGYVAQGGRIGGLIAYNASQNKLYCYAGDSAIAVLDPVSDSVIRIVTVGSHKRGATISPDGTRLFMLADEGQTMVALDCRGDSVLASRPLGNYFGSIAFSATQNRLFCLGSLNGARVLECSTYQVVDSIVAPRGTGLALWNAASDRVYYPMDNRMLVVIDCATNELAAYVDVGSQPKAMLCDSIRNKVYLSCIDGLWVVDASNRATRDADSITGSGHLAWNPAYNRVYLARTSTEIRVYRDEVGVAESGQIAQQGRTDLTIICGMLLLPSASGAGRQASGILIDISGRKVLDLMTGPNDVRRLAPGVYFVRDARAQAQAQAVSKVVITK